MIVIAYDSINIKFKLIYGATSHSSGFPAAGRGELLGEYMGGVSGCWEYWSHW